ncbi:MAG: hypothetical protein CMB80_14090 [Flammeovirgaceae bacterium]|nr:hypothetical protein [Flammeovirgaceae bacterium]HCX24553.1 hypothetical protein [Cytophagales bacterium]
MIKNSILTFIFSASITIYSFGQDMQRTVTIKAYDKSLEQVLELISDQYDVSFSYMNNELPDNHVDVDFEGISLDHALSNLLEGFGYEHITKSGKVIIKKKVEITETPEVVEQDTIQEEIDEPILEEAQEVDPGNPNSHVVLGGQETEEMDLPESANEEPEAIVDLENTQEPEELSIEEQQVSRYQPGSGVVITYKSGNTSEEYSNVDQGPFKRIFPHEEDSLIEKTPLEKRIAHFGLFYPFSTNGFYAKDYINNISLHLFAGYSGGLEGFEYAGLASIIKGHGRGLQLSGVANLVSGEFTGAQISGITNVTWYDFEGLQLAGITNISYDRNLGAQVSGVANIARGRVSGFQAAGIVNSTYGESRFGQVAGVYNYAWSLNGLQASMVANSTGNIKGLQVSGFLNLANKVEGVQVAGFINDARDVNGAQLAPFLNIAKKVHGVQIGLINISDEMHGTPIGLFCLAKRNGYFDLEVFYSDDFQANANIKIGAPHFHNIFAFSYETDYKNRWAYGYGFGSQWGRGDFRLNTDLVSYYVVEDQFPNGGFRDFELNLLSRFRFLPSFHLGDFGIFAGPTFNMMISEHTDLESGMIGSDITPTPLHEYTRFGTNWKFWIGYNVGIRI